jgi:PKD repeat protein
MVKKLIVWTIVVLLIIMLVPVISADQGNSNIGNMNIINVKNTELPELDMTGLHTDIDLIEIDPEITNATPDWMLLAHDDIGKKAFLDDIESSSSSPSEKTGMKNAVQNLWNTYPTKFEPAGEKSIKITIQSDGSNQTKTIPIGHVTRISFDHEKIKQVTQGRNISQAMELRPTGPSSPIVLNESENQTIQNITRFRANKIQQDRAKYSTLPVSGSVGAASSGNSLSSDSDIKITILSPGLMAWGGMLHTGQSDILHKYTGHNSMIYWAANNTGFPSGYVDTAAQAGMYPDDVIDNPSIPSWIPFGYAINRIYHSYYHYYNPEYWNLDTLHSGIGGAPGRCLYFASIASGYYQQHDYANAATNSAYASHYLEDVGNPMHTGREYDQYNDVASFNFDTHGNYETYVESNWSESPIAPFGTEIANDNYYYTVTDPSQATINLATFSHAYIDTLYYRVRNNPGLSDKGFYSDNAVRLISENCLIASERYSKGLFKYVEGSSIANSPPVPDFTYQVQSQDSTSATILFTDTSTGETSRAWSFGDGQTSALSPVTHTYNGIKDYYAQLGAVNSYGTTTKVVIIPVGHLPPSTAFSKSPTNLMTFQFTDDSYPKSGDGKITKWIWDFDDFPSSPSTLQNPSHAFFSTGKHSVKLTAGNIYGDSSFSQDVWVLGGAQAQYVYEIINAYTVKFTSHTGAASYAWNFGDNTTSTDQNPTHVYQKAGTYAVNLTVKDAYYNNSYNSTIQNIVISLPPLANFTATPPSGPAPLTIRFNDTSTGSPTSWLWDFGDGNTTNAAEQNPVHTYLANGSFTVSLNATNAVGSNTTTKARFINVGIQDKIGFFRNGFWLLDYNGNYQWDGPSVDRTAWLGQALDNTTIGDWGGTGNGKIGVFRNGLWVIDYNGNYSWDGTSIDKAASLGQAGDIPVVGNWNGDGTGDKIGVFRNGLWVIDYNGNYSWDGTSIDKAASLGQAGDIPVVGDWNGDGKKKIGFFRNGFWLLDYNGNYQWDGPSVDKTGSLGQSGDIPVIGDWNGDGKDEIGVFRNGLWVIDYNGNYGWDGTSIDRAASLGQAGDIPVIGDWNGDGKKKIGVFRNGLWVIDYNGNFGWDGTSIDKAASLGQAGDIPVIGKW